MTDPMIAYYARRAPDYERIYQRPERLADLRKLTDRVSTAFAGRSVLEVACGTGYWTQVIARSARSVLGIDCSDEVLRIARRKAYRPCQVTFRRADAYHLPGPDDPLEGGFCGFWWSHVPKTRLAGFLEVFHAKLERGAPVIVIDNRYVPGNSTPVARSDPDGNTYQARTLPDGTRWEIVKNYPTPDQLRQRLIGLAGEVEIIEFTYYWLMKYTTGGPG